MIIKLNRPGNISKNSLILTLSFFAYVIISTLILINIDDGNLAFTPVNLEYFGRNFVIGHLGVLTGFILLLTSIAILNKTGHLKNPLLLYIAQEKKEFKKRYNLSFSENITKSKRNLLYLLAIGSTFLPALLPMIAIHYFGVEDHTFAAALGIILMFTGFYKSVGAMMYKSKLQAADIIAEVNKLHPDTNLTSDQYDLEHTFISAGFDMSFEGTYRGRNVKVEYSTIGFHTGRTVNVNTKSFASIEINSKADFELEERNTKVKSINCVSIDDGFAKRFNYNSLGGYYFTTKTKEICLNYPRLINLKVNNSLLIYEIENVDILPYYSIEGMILFLDYLISVAGELEK